MAGYELYAVSGFELIGSLHPDPTQGLHIKLSTKVKESHKHLCMKTWFFVQC